MEKMKRLVYVLFMSMFLVCSFPVLAQSDNNRDRDRDRDRTEVEVDRDNDKDDEKSTASDRREDSDEREARNDDDDDNDGDGGKWGLLGLGGLLGLRRTNDKGHHTTTRPLGSTGPGHTGGTSTGGTHRPGGTSDRTDSGSGTIITP